MVNFRKLCYCENEVIALAKDSDGEDINIITGTRAVEVGQPIYAWRMRKWAGVDPADWSSSMVPKR